MLTRGLWSKGDYNFLIFIVKAKAKKKKISGLKVQMNHTKVLADGDRIFKKGDNILSMGRVEQTGMLSQDGRSIHIY